MDLVIRKITGPVGSEAIGSGQDQRGSGKQQRDTRRNQSHRAG